METPPPTPQCDLVYVFVRTYFLLLRHLAFDFAFLFSSSGDDSDICMKSKHFPAWKALLFGINLRESRIWAAARISAQSTVHLARGAVRRATKPRGSSTQMWEMSAERGKSSVLQGNETQGSTLKKTKTKKTKQSWELQGISHTRTMGNGKIKREK